MTTPTENSQGTPQPTGETDAMATTEQAPQATQETTQETAESEIQAAQATDAKRVPLERGRLKRYNFLYLPTSSAAGVFTRDTALAFVEKRRENYLAERDRLEPAAKELAKLEKVRDAAERQRTEAGSWRKSFIEDLGKQRKSVRDQRKAEREWQIEAEQHAEMVEMMQPQMEWLRLHTQLAREGFQQALRDAGEALNQYALFEAMETTFDSQEGETIAAQLQRFKEFVETSVCNDVPYMLAAFGADVSLQPGHYIKSHLSASQWAELEDEIHKRYCAALGEMVLGAIPKGIKPARIESLESIEPLSCEDGRNIYSGQLDRARRAKELQAQLGIAEN